MRTALKIATVLSWINLILFGFITLCLLLSALVMGPVILIGAILFCAIPLNCYAALQLHKSIRDPALKLSHQTPAGIRFVGFVALFFGIMITSSNIGNLLHPAEWAESLRQGFTQMGMKDTSRITVPFVRECAVVGTLLGLSVVVNVMLNFRLLRWYYLVQQSDASQRDAAGRDSSGRDES
ncbi:MAG TPA: hypothetical protein VNW04_19500 [Puia sp.]|jgi:hypothetical protein|nr:hypothetical protein [Puia sp.]